MLKKRKPLEGLPERLIEQRNVIRTVLGQQWWQATLLSVGRLVFDYLCLLFCVRAVGAHPRPSLILLAYAVAGVIGLIPITPGGIGIVEASLAGFLALAGLDGAQAVLATLAYRLASYWLPMLAGPIAYAAFRYRYRHHGRPTPGARGHDHLAGGRRTARYTEVDLAVGPQGAEPAATLLGHQYGQVVGVGDTWAQARRPSGVRQATTARSGEPFRPNATEYVSTVTSPLAVGVRGALGERTHRGLGIGPGEPGRRLDHGALGQPVLAAGSDPRWIGAVDPDAVLDTYHPSPVVSPVVPGSFAQDTDHGGQRVGPVVVAGPAGEGHPPGHGQRARRVVDRQAQFGGGDLHRRGEARVEVDMVHLVDRRAGQRQGGGPGQADGGRGVEVGPVGEEPVVLGVRPGQREDPAVAWDPRRHRPPRPSTG